MSPRSGKYLPRHPRDRAGNQQALISLILALSDQIAQDVGAFAKPWRTSRTSRPLTTGPTTPASFGSAGPRLATRDGQGPAIRLRMDHPGFGAI